MEKPKITVEDFERTMRIYGWEPSLKGLEEALTKLKRLTGASEIAVRSFVKAGIEVHI